ncbi:MAG: hypothetical protein MJ186_01915 [Clostridia bacterium]|nr:hypothetical protein [Clostridia bacterium]
MKKFLTVVVCIILLYLGLDFMHYNMGLYIDFHKDEVVTTATRTSGKEILLNRGNGFEPFEIKGVDMGSGIPGEWATDFAADEETYLRWFKLIKEMGANTIRVYTVQEDIFYNAFYKYNKDNDDPLYLIQGVWVNDYIQNSHIDAFDPKFVDAFIDNCRVMIDVVHGNRKINLGTRASSGSGTYKKDISPWVLGYILGVEWEDVTVVYTNEKYKSVEGSNQYIGEYMYTSRDASPFEAMLARVGDQAIAYETERYREQRIIAFSNWPTTDPFKYPDFIEKYFMKCAEVNVENILSTEEFLSGQFISYHVYPYYPDYLTYMDNWTPLKISHADFLDENGTLNTYRAYLTALNKFHTMPVVISEFGVSTGRGMAQKDQNTGRNQGNMSESGQGKALVECYEDIKASGCAGCCIFTWQDEWFKRTWNTMYAVNLKRNPYWSDYQTNEQYFGLLSFDPGDEKSVCYVDGDVSEWTEEDLVSDNNETKLYMKYDEKFIYFMVNKPGLKFGEDTIYIPIDTTPKSGTTWCRFNGLTFDKAVDFMLTIHGMDDSRLQVQEYYEALRSTYSENVHGINSYYEDNIPDKDSPEFVNIDMILQTATALLEHDNLANAEVFETGKLTYGNANPDSPSFNSLADFISKGDCIEIKLPWQLLNFADPSRMTIHDDYYSGFYGVDFTTINCMHVGVADGSNERRMVLDKFNLKGWNNKETSHERLKRSYYVMKDLWAN